tara:strand:+ start:3503 stop:4048 length:546 start_codon:yes stop_codon:yes gene_type:complete
MNRRHINTRQRQHIANTSQQSYIKPYVSQNTEQLTLENSIKQIEVKMDFLLERLDTLQYKILQMEFISTDINSHSQQLELLKNKVMEMSKQNAIENIFKDVINLNEQSDIPEDNLEDKQKDKQKDKQEDEQEDEPEDEPEDESEDKLEDEEEDESEDKLEDEDEPNILFNLKYKVLKPSSK